MDDDKARVIDVGRDPDLVMNATCSSFYDGNDIGCDFTSGLSYRWDCAKEGEF